MLEVLSGLQARDLRVFHVEPNYWWHNYAQEFIEFAYIQVRAIILYLLDMDCACIFYGTILILELWFCKRRSARLAKL